GDRGRARTVGAEAVGSGVGVALLDHDVVGGDADLRRQDLGVGRLVPLPLALGAEPGDRRARRVDADLAAVEHADAQDIAVTRRAGADDLGEEGDTDAHQLAGLAAGESGAAVLLFGPQRLVMRLLHGLLHGRRIVAAVVLPAQRRLIGK